MAPTASERLRRSLVTDLRMRGLIRSDRVATAFLEVARERFVPAALAAGGLEAVYHDEAIVTKRDTRGLPLSSSSQPAIMAQMLELLDPRPGDRVLEIGAGTGYNAALLAHLVGPRGHVTSVDIDPDLARKARRSIRLAGSRVSIAVGDGRHGHPDAAPYDRIMVTACADELPRAWLDQLAPGGRLELPLRVDPEGAAIQLIPVLERRGPTLHSVGLTWGWFMPLHSGDGGRRPPPTALSASHMVQGRHTSLAALSGPGIERLSARAARALLAALLANSQPARQQGMTELGGTRPPLLLLYLLLSIPDSRRVSLTSKDRQGIGIIHPPSESLAVVSMRRPWNDSSPPRPVRARWRLDAYGNDRAADELERLLLAWQELQQAGRTELHITAGGRTDALQLRFAWGRPAPSGP